MTWTAFAHSGPHRLLRGRRLQQGLGADMEFKARNERPPSFCHSSFIQFAILSRLHTEKTQRHHAVTSGDKIKEGKDKQGGRERLRLLLGRVSDRLDLSRKLNCSPIDGGHQICPCVDQNPEHATVEW